MANLRKSGVFSLGSLSGDFASNGDANWSDVTLLLDGSSETDVTGLSSIVERGTVTSGNTPSKFSHYTDFDNTTTQDNLKITLPSALGASNEPFTIETWARFDVLGASGNEGVFQLTPSGTTIDGTGLSGGVSGATSLGLAAINNQWRVYNEATNIDNLGAVVADRWYHLALTSDGTTLRWFVDGSQIYSIAIASTSVASGGYPNLVVGCYYTQYYAMNGRIEGFRVTKAVARYTAAFNTDPVITSPAAWPTSTTGASSTRPTRKWGGMLGRSLTTDVDAAPVVDHSLRFDGSADYLNRVVTASNRRTWTWSAWVKKNDLGVRDYLFSGGATGVSTDLFYLYWESNTTASRNNQLYVIWREASDYAISAATRNLETSASYNDTSAWYHVVLSVDTTKSNSSDRMKIYIDGAEVSYANDNRNSIVSSGLSVNAAGNLCMGAYAYDLTSTTSRFKGQMAEVHFVDGQALTAADFGEANASGQWVPKEVKGLTYGNNGFHLPFSTPSSTTNAFNAVTFVGDGANSRAVSGVGFQADMIWLKNRDTAYSHQIVDTVRGAKMALLTNSTLDEGDTQADFTGGGVETITADGFTIGNGTQSNNNLNASGDKIVGWAWKAGGAPTSNNSATSGSAMVDGVATTTSSIASAASASITPQKMSVNTEAGFSIVSYDGVSTAGTVPHGLDQAPEMVIIKCTDFPGSSWNTYSATTGASQKLFLNEPNQATSTSLFNNTAPTSNVFSIYSPTTNPETNKVGYNFIAYCWHSVPGYSKIGSYTGSGGAGNKITTGFQPAFVMIKNVTTSGNDWHIIDNTRDETNVRSARLKANTADIENPSDNALNFLADGFDHYGSSGARNASGNTYIYMAFADTSPNLGLDATTDGKGVTLLVRGDTLTDLSGNQTLTANNGASAGDSTQYKYSTSGSLSFDGVDDYISLGNSDVLDITGGDWTIEAWVRPQELANWQTIAAYSGGGGGAWNGTTGFEWMFLYGTTDFGLHYYNGTTVATVQAAHGMSVGTWYHLAVTRQGNTIRVFVDGSQITSATATPVATTSPTETRIGQGDASATLPLEGNIEDFRVTKGTARDIASGFSSGTPISGGGWDVSLTNDNTWSGKPQNNFAVNGSITPDDQLLDTPNLRFATLDPSNKNSSATLSEANLKLATVNGAGWESVLADKAIAPGDKVYFEWRTPNTDRLAFGGVATTLPANTSYMGGASDNWSFYVNGLQDFYFYNSGQPIQPTVGPTVGGNNIGMCAVDRVNNRIHFGYNGYWWTSTSSTSTTLGTYAPYTSASTPQFPSTGSLFPSFSGYNGTSGVWEANANFGQDHTFAGALAPLSSPFTDSAGNGEFRYQPPLGFKALTTKIVGSDTALQSTGVISLAEHYQTKLPQP